MCLGENVDALPRLPSGYTSIGYVQARQEYIYIERSMCSRPFRSSRKRVCESSLILQGTAYRSNEYYGGRSQTMAAGGKSGGGKLVLQPSAERFIQSHKVSAELDTTKWLTTSFSPSVTMTYSNMPPIHGRDNCHLLFEPFFTRLAEMTHYIESFDFISAENKILQAARIVYRVKGDPEEKVMEIPGFAAFTLGRDEDGIVRLGKAQTWLDPSPVVESMMRVHGKEAWEKEMSALMQKVMGGA